MTFRTLSRGAIMPILICAGLGLGCSKDKPFIPVLGEHIIKTEPGETIKTPDRTGAWYSDSYIHDRFEDCLLNG